MASGSAPAASPARSTDYWQKAFDRLDDDLKSALSSTNTRKLEIIDAVIKAAEEKRQLCIRKRWTYKTPGGKVVVLRDVLEKVVGWIDRFKAVGDLAVQYDPVCAALPWAAFRFLLNITCGDVQDFGYMVTLLETVARTASRCRIVEVLYLSRPSDTSGLLEDALLRLYTDTLVLLAKSVRYFGRSTGARLLSSSFRPMIGGGDDDIKTIESRESEVSKLASLADTQVLQGLDTKTSQLADNTMNALRGMDAKFTRLLDTTAITLKSLEEKKLNELLAWLSPAAFARHHRAISGQRLPGSGNWLITHTAFQEWLASSYSSILLLHGVRGCGKSTAFSAVVDYLLPQARVQTTTTRPAAPCAYFYCVNSPSEPERAAPECVLRSIVRQLAVGPRDGTVNQVALSAYDRKAKAFERDRTDPGEFGIDECITLFLELTVANPAFVAIDAMDELQDNDRATLVEALKRVVAESVSVVKIFITGSDNAHLQALLQSETKIRVTPACNHDDVEAFVKYQLEAATRKRLILNGNVSARLLQDISKALLQGSGEMFLWARLQIDFLCRKKTEQDILAALRKGLAGNLDQIYRRVRDHIFELDPVAKRVVQQIFSWLLFARRSLNQEVFHSILQLDPDIQLSERVDIVDVCYNLVMLDPELDTLCFCHSSARDFMRQQEDICSVDSANQLLAKVCLRQCASGPGVSRFSGDRSPIKEFYHYAAVHWPHHVRHSGVASREPDHPVLRGMISFVFDEGNSVSPAFIVWLEWIRQIALDLPHYHPFKSIFEPLSSPGMSPLFAACVFGLPSLLGYALGHPLMDMDRDMDEKSDTGHTGIYLACSYGHNDVVSMLLSHNANFGVECGTFGSSLHVACFRGHTDVVATLLRHGASPHGSSVAFSNAFEASCRGGHEDIAASLAKEYSTTWTGDDHKAAVREAIEAGFRDLVEWLISPATVARFSSVDNRASNRDPAGELLSVAIKRGQVSVLQSLLQMKPHWEAALPKEAMALAALAGHTDMVAFLYGLSMDPEVEGPFGSALRSASLMGNETIVRLLLGWGADANACGSKGDSLQAAAQNGHTQVMRFLIEEGAEVNQKGGPRGTCLQAAAYYGHCDAVELLIERGADIYQRGRSKDTLYAAIEGGHEEIASLLLTKGYHTAQGAPLPHITRGFGGNGSYGASERRPWNRRKLRRECQSPQSVRTETITDNSDTVVSSADDNLAGDEENDSGPWDTADAAVDCSSDDSSDDDSVDERIGDGDDGVSALEFSAAVGNIPNLRQNLLRPETQHGDVAMALRASATRGKLNSLEVVLDEGMKYFENPKHAVSDALIAAAKNGQAKAAQILYGKLQESGNDGDLGSWAAALNASVSSGDQIAISALLCYCRGPSQCLLEVFISAVETAAKHRRPKAATVLWDWLLQDGDGQKQIAGKAGTTTGATPIAGSSLLELCLKLERANENQSAELTKQVETSLGGLLTAALRSNTTAMVERLLAKMEEEGCGVDSIMPAFAAACRHGSRAMKWLLARRSGNLALTSEHLSIGSYTAAIFGHGRVLYDLVGEQLDRGIYPRNTTTTTAVLDNAFIGAAEHGHLTIVKRLLRTDRFRSNFVDAISAINQGMIAATEAGHVEIVHLCLGEGADIHHPPERSSRMEHFGEKGGIVLEVNSTDSISYIHWLSSLDSTKPHRLFLKHWNERLGAMELSPKSLQQLRNPELSPESFTRLRPMSPESLKRLGNPGLAAKLSRREVVNGLQAALAGFRRARHDDMPGYADNRLDCLVQSEQRQEELVFLMLERGCDPSDKGRQAESPIQMAAQWANDRVVQRLLEAGVDADASDDDGGSDSDSDWEDESDDGNNSEEDESRRPVVLAAKRDSPSLSA